jgi:hypothetical protein
MSWNTTGATNGAHSVTAVARDAAGNQTTAAAVSVTVSNDTTPPTISTVAAGSITTAGATVTWTTNEASDSQVDYGKTTTYGSSTTLNTALVTSHSATLTGLTDATLYHYRVRSRDAANNVAVSGDFTFTTLDGTPPSVTVTAPPPGSTVSGTVTITATASDNVGVVGVQFKVDGANLGAEDTASAYSFAWDTTSVVNGSHTLTAFARDAAGNATTSASVAVTVSNGATTLSLSPQDTYLNLDATNYSTQTTLTAYTWPDNEAANAILMKFDLSSLPPGAVVQQATLRLALVDSDTLPEATYTVTANKVVGKNPVIAAATGYTIDGTNPWTSNTCCSGGVPLAQADISTAYDTQAIDKTLGYKSWTLTTMVKEWIANPSSNVGVLLDADTSKTHDHYRTFASMEYADATLRPYLQIVYAIGAPDTTPPVISAVAAGSLTMSTAAITWTTNEIADSQVDYGLTTAYGTTSPLIGSLVTAHAVALSGLTANTLYHYRVRSHDAANNVAVSGDFTFTTLADVKVTLAWDPNTETDLAGYKVYVGTASRTYTTTLDVGNVTTCTVNGLVPGQVYYFAVTAYDTSRNESTFSNEVSR